MWSNEAKINSAQASNRDPAKSFSSSSVIMVEEKEAPRVIVLTRHECQNDMTATTVKTSRTPALVRAVMRLFKT
jgi:hypothetical protein